VLIEALDGRRGKGQPYDKLAASYLAFVQLAAIRMWP
jgi:hypothetical protein